ncbi:hypothetical protein LXT12_26395 [Pelomonas sp. P7]|uniref:Uncharacterized protein n=1 Tax=Pelomonas caseinilytica TaxID=2906763 RepID=A0ABS8XQ29_9BURK|nr:hypothetical protein [Pelomonas sp. P7]MCE4540764.1 hypothetical protein [Pelomonas sp. P7]
MSSSSRFLFQPRVMPVFLACALIGAAASAQTSQPVRSNALATGASPSVVVDALNLTEISEKISTGLYIGAVVSSPRIAEGIQKAADVWGLHVDLFVEPNPQKVDQLAADLSHNGAIAVIVEPGTGSSTLAVLKASLLEEKSKRGFEIPVVQVAAARGTGTNRAAALKADFDEGFDALQRARNQILPQIPKFDEIFPIIFPISPLPDHFFQASKFPYPDPLIRSVRTVSSRSASTHAHVSCHAGSLLGNMIHRTSSVDPDVLLIGFEGGNLSIRPEPGAISRDKLSAIMTSYVFAVRGDQSERRDLLSENDGRETSAFKPTIHAPEELEAALKAWVSQAKIAGYQFRGSDEVVIKGLKGKDRRFRASFFLISTDAKLVKPSVELVTDRFGRWALETISTQQFRQVLSEVPMEGAASGQAMIKALDLPSEAERSTIKDTTSTFIGKPLAKVEVQPKGGLLNAAGASVGTVVGFPLGALLYEVDSKKVVTYRPYVLTIEGGFLVVTPEEELTQDLLQKKVSRVDFDERGPLGADQTLWITLEDNHKVQFRRTVLQQGHLDEALAGVKQQGWISGWEYSGARGQGLEANIIVYNFLGKNRKFMSSLNTWPSNDRPATPQMQWYVDGMQRLNFSLLTPEGWRQEFVEVPIAIPPMPRDMKLYSGISKLD